MLIGKTIKNKLSSAKNKFLSVLNSLCNKNKDRGPNEQPVRPARPKPAMDWSPFLVQIKMRTGMLDVIGRDLLQAMETGTREANTVLDGLAEAARKYGVRRLGKKWVRVSRDMDGAVAPDELENRRGMLLEYLDQDMQEAKQSLRNLNEGGGGTGQSGASEIIRKYLVSKGWQHGQITKYNYVTVFLDYFEITGQIKALEQARDLVANAHSIQDLAQGIGVITRGTG